MVVPLESGAGVMTGRMLHAPWAAACTCGDMRCPECRPEVDEMRPEPVSSGPYVPMTLRQVADAFGVGSLTPEERAGLEAECERRAA